MVDWHVCFVISRGGARADSIPVSSRLDFSAALAVAFRFRVAPYPTARRAGTLFRPGRGCGER